MRNFVGITLTVTLTALTVAACAWLAVKASAVILLLLVAAIAASAMAPLGERISRVGLLGGKRLPPALGLSIAYLAVAAAGAGIVSFYVYQMSDDVRRLAERAPFFYSNALATLDALKQHYPWLPDPRAVLADLRNESGLSADLTRRFMGFTLGAAGLAAAFVTTLVLSFYMVLEAPHMHAALLRLLPPRHRAEVGRRLTFVGARFGAWVRGQMLVALIMGTTTTVAMYLIGMPYPFFIGGIVAVTDLVPLLGGTLGAVPALLIALFQPRWQLAAVVIFFLVLQQLENNVLLPRVMSKAVRISPLVTIVALLVGGSAYGIAGAFVAVPLAAALQVFAPFALRLARGQYRELDAA